MFDVNYDIILQMNVTYHSVFHIKILGVVLPHFSPPKTRRKGGETNPSKIARKNGALGICTDIYVDVWKHM